MGRSSLQSMWPQHECFIRSQSVACGGYEPTAILYHVLSRVCTTMAVLAAVVAICCFQADVLIFYPDFLVGPGGKINQIHCNVP